MKRPIYNEDIRAMRVWRRRAKLSQIVIAHLIDRSQTLISYYESGMLIVPEELQQPIFDILKSTLDGRLEKWARPEHLSWLWRDLRDLRGVRRSTH